MLSSAKGVPVAAARINRTAGRRGFCADLRDEQRMWLATFSQTLLAGGLSWLFLRFQFSPLVETAKTLADLADTDKYPPPLSIRSQDEIGQLIGGFNHLLKTLCNRERLIRVSEGKRYRVVFQASQDAINIGRLSDGLFIEANQSFYDIHGFERDEVVGHTSPELKIWFDPADRQRFVEVLQRDSKCFNLEARFRRKNGELIWGLGICSRNRTLMGSPVFYPLDALLLSASMPKRKLPI